jgi:hypothetical protein
MMNAAVLLCGDDLNCNSSLKQMWRFVAIVPGNILILFAGVIR